MGFEIKLKCLDFIKCPMQINERKGYRKVYEFKVA